MRRILLASALYLSGVLANTFTAEDTAPSHAFLELHDMLGAHHPSVSQSSNGIEVTLNQNYMVDVILGSNNQSSSMSISFNTDMIIIPSSECNFACEKRSYIQSQSNSAKTILADGAAEFTSMDFANFSAQANPLFTGKTVKDRVCLKGAQEQTCLVANGLATAENHPEFLYVKNYQNPLSSTSKFKLGGILGLAPSERTSLNSYLQYLKQKKLITVNGFAINQNLVGSRSRLHLGYFNESQHILNYTYRTAEELMLPQGMRTFDVIGVKFANYTHPAAIVPEGGDIFKDAPRMQAVISNMFPYIMFQMILNETDMIQSVISSVVQGSMFKWIDAKMSIFQAFVPATDCSDVTIIAHSAIVEFVSEYNHKFKLSQSLFRQDGEDCLCMVLFSVNSTNDLLILGMPAFFNMNVTVDFDRNLIGFSSGISQTKVAINYTPRVAVMLVVFGTIALLGLCLSKSIDTTRRENELVKQRQVSEEEENLRVSQRHGDKSINQEAEELN